jgi:hypothetical protein
MIRAHALPFHRWLELILNPTWQLEILQEEHTIRPHALTSCRCLESTLDPTPPPLTELCPCIGPYSCKGIHSSNTCTSSKQTYNPIWWDHGSESLLHPLVEVDIPPFVNDSHLETDVTLIGRHLSLFWLVQHVFFPMAFQICYMNFYTKRIVPNDYANGFDLFFEVCGHIVQGHVPPLVLLLFFTCQFLTLEK